MVALLVSLSIMGVLLSVALPVWRTTMRREREAELIFRGEQYVRAITLFQRKYAGTFPPTLDALLQERFLRRRYLDPMTRGEFQLLYAGVPSEGARREGLPPAVTDGRRGILGVVSRSKERSLRLYQGRGRYNEWMFIATESSPGSRTAAGSPPGQEEEGNDVRGPR
jgi:type II secretory pathway pseudopilin PulG